MAIFPYILLKQDENAFERRTLHENVMRYNPSQKKESNSLHSTVLTEISKPNSHPNRNIFKKNLTKSLSTALVV